MKDVGVAVLAGSSSPFLGRERAAVDVDVGPERRSPCRVPGEKGCLQSTRRERFGLIERDVGLIATMRPARQP